jgi:Putative restriction endonuclease
VALVSCRIIPPATKVRANGASPFRTQFSVLKGLPGLVRTLVAGGISLLDIPEYWIVDPIEMKVTISTLKDGAYMDQVFTGNNPVVFLTFPSLTLKSRPINHDGRLFLFWIN